VERIVLTIPREREFSAVADLVLAGLGSRHDLTIDVIDDLQLALEALVDRDDLDDELTVRIEVVGDAIVTSVGPFRRDAMESELAGESGPALGLRRLLDTTVDHVALVAEDSVCWIELRKALRKEVAH
jgi:hypothetical protein